MQSISRTIPKVERELVSPQPFFGVLASKREPADLRCRFARPGGRSGSEVLA